MTTFAEKLKYHARKVEEYTRLYEQAKAAYEAALREELKGDDSTDITPGTAYDMTKQIMQAEAKAKFEDNYLRTY